MVICCSHWHRAGGFAHLMRLLLFCCDNLLLFLVLSLVIAIPFLFLTTNNGYWWPDGVIVFKLRLVFTICDQWQIGLVDGRQRVYTEVIGEFIFTNETRKMSRWLIFSAFSGNGLLFINMIEFFAVPTHIRYTAHIGLLPRINVFSVKWG